MNKKIIIPAVIVLLLTNTASFYVGSTKSIVLPDATVVARADVVKFGKMFETRSQLYKYFANGDINDNLLVDGAIKGMTNSLNDPYTVFMNKKDYDDFNSKMQGTYSGIGIVVEAKDNLISVISTFDDSPAKKSGVIPKDTIIKVDGKDVSGKNLDAAIALIKGTDGTPVTVTFYRESKGSFDLKLIRQKITTPSVKGEVLGDNIGYIKMDMFDANTGSEFNKELSKLKDKNIKGLILDLRDNGGGYLDQCIDVTSNFVKKDDTIVYTIDKNNHKIVDNSIGGLAYKMPLVVLLNGNTASASEVFSGAIRDYKAGTLIGTKTFGKGIVQTTFLDKNDGTALKVTTSKYYSPLGINIQKIGITPDLIVEYPDELKAKGDRTQDPQFQKALEVMKDKIK